VKRKFAFGLFVALAMIFTACSSASEVVTPVRDLATTTVKTLIPTRETSLQLTPYPVVYLATTRAGQEIQFRRIMFEANEYVAFHTESVPQGIPIINGVEISFDYITQVDFDNPSSDWNFTPQANSSPEPLINPSGELVLPDLISGLGNWPVTITLTDGSMISTSLGFKARHKIHLTGDSDYGFLDIPLVDFQKLVIKRASASKPIPSQPPGDDTITIQTVSDDIVSIAYPKLFTICMYDVYCCRGEDLTLLPLESADVPLDEIRSIGFSNEMASVTFKDGKTLDGKLRPSPDCPGIGWRLRGKSALGDFELPLSLIKKIELAN
jgi:hypothetical protein